MATPRSDIARERDPRDPAGGCEHLAHAAGGVREVRRRRPGEDGGLDLPRGRVFAPEQLQVEVHPVGRACLVPRVGSIPVGAKLR